MKKNITVIMVTIMMVVGFFCINKSYAVANNIEQVMPKKTESTIVQLKEKEQELENINVLLSKKAQEETKNAKFENYKILENNLNESKNKFNKLQEFFKEGIPTDIEIETLIEKCLLIEKYKVEIKNYEISTSNNSEIEKLKGVFQGKELSEKKINSVISEYNGLNDVENKIKLNEEKIITLKKEQEEVIKQKNKSKRFSILFGVFALICVMAGFGTFAVHIISSSIVFFAIRYNIIRFNICKNKFI